MATLKEKMEELAKLRNKRAVLKYIVLHLDTTFLRPMEVSQKMVLLTDEKTPVPDIVFDEAIKGMLEEVEQLDAQIESILEASIQ
jgi:hypothetical protein